MKKSGETGPQSSTLRKRPGADQLYRIARLAPELARLLDLTALSQFIVKHAVEETSYRRAILLLMEPEDQTLAAVAQYPETDSGSSSTLTGARVAWQPENDAVQQGWLLGHASRISHAEQIEQGPLYWLMLAVDASDCFGLPLQAEGTLAGVLLVDHPLRQIEADQSFLLTLAPILASALLSAQRYTRTVQESETRFRQLDILRQIDRELNDNIQLDHVFAMTLDWALRYTNAQAASLAFYVEQSDELRYVADVGYALSESELAAIRSNAGPGVAHRVARSGRTEVVPDVALDKDFLAISPATRSYMAAPITREERVIAVISLDSKKLNAFTDDHVDFIEKLSARAGVAIDNARLFGETARERSKLERILRHTADIILVVDESGAVEIINTSALVAFGLSPSHSYRGLPVSDVLQNADLDRLYRQAVASGEAAIGEVTLHDQRTYYANLTPCPGIGWVIVMHDITPLKKTDHLKSELIAAVSHDLKQPLGIMHGYTELLALYADDAEQVYSIVPQLQRAIGNMRRLIDDQLDLARLESGIQLEIEPVHLRPLLADCVERLFHTIAEKALSVRQHIPADLPVVSADSQSLSRIFDNIIGNAVKYTPDGGSIEIAAETSGDRVRVSVKDDGLGISPEDQTRVFDRFYRVRRREYDHIDGTGLGLAIVKRLVDLHQGQIGLSSTPGEGTVFTITLPIHHKTDTSTFWISEA